MSRICGAGIRYEVCVRLRAGPRGEPAGNAIQENAVPGGLRKNYKMRGWVKLSWVLGRDRKIACIVGSSIR